jgi:hypothetical protein
VRKLVIGSSNNREEVRMFEDMPISLIIAWSLFTVFVFYQKLHIRDFQGASQGFLLMLNLSAFGSMILSVGVKPLLGA